MTNYFSPVKRLNFWTVSAIEFFNILSKVWTKAEEPISLCVFHLGTAVSVGKGLVSRLVFSDPAFCAERTVYSGWRHMGGDGKHLTLFSLI